MAENKYKKEFFDALEKNVSVTWVKVVSDGFSELTHRDYLGAILSLGIKRDFIKDIIVPDSREAYIGIYDRMNALSFLEDNLKTVGKSRVGIFLCEEGFEPEKHQKFEDISFTSPSLRLDAIVSSIASVSRSTAVEMIDSDCIKLNGEVKKKATLLISEGDILSVRGHGRFLFEREGERNRKDRIRLHFKKYI